MNRSLSNEHKQRQTQGQIGQWKRIQILESDTSKRENLAYDGNIMSQLGNDVGTVGSQHEKNEMKALPETIHKDKFHSIWIVNGLQT